MIAYAFKIRCFALVLIAAGAVLSVGCRRDVGTAKESAPPEGLASRAECAEPAVKPDEACYYAKPCYEGLIRCVGAGESYKADGAVVNSVVLGSHVTLANTSTCQFYGPDVAYARALEGCSTDRLWTDTATIHPDT